MKVPEVLGTSTNKLFKKLLCQLLKLSCSLGRHTARSDSNIVLNIGKTRSIFRLGTFLNPIHCNFFMFPPVRCSFMTLYLMALSANSSQPLSLVSSHCHIYQPPVPLTIYQSLKAPCSQGSPSGHRSRLCTACFLLGSEEPRHYSRTPLFFSLCSLSSLSSFNHLPLSCFLFLPRSSYLSCVCHLGLMQKFLTRTPSLVIPALNPHICPFLQLKKK